MIQAKAGKILIQLPEDQISVEIAKKMLDEISLEIKGR